MTNEEKVITRKDFEEVKARTGGEAHPEFNKVDGGRSAPTSSDRIRFKQAILKAHADSPQRSALVGLALDTLFDGVDRLARLGHIVVVSEGDFVGAGTEWPKMLYHEDHPEGKVFHEFNAPTGAGWGDKPLVAKADGEAKPEGDASSRSAGPESRSAPGFPKKLFHEHVPGGVVVQNADQEDEYLGRGWTTERPDRGGVNYGSQAEATEARPPQELGSNPAPQAQRRNPTE